MSGCTTCVFHCVRVSKWIPVVFLMSIMSWAYYAYVVQLCIYNVNELPKQIMYIIFFHVFLFMFLWSYAKTIFTNPARPPDEFYLEQTEIYQMEIAHNDAANKLIIEQKAKGLPILNRTSLLGVRYCEKCKCLKPDRSHHCGACNTCVLKMDHHCPWVNNCVGYSNYKFFILFLSYAFIFCLYIATTSFEYFIEFWNEIKNFQPGRFHLLFLFFVSTMFAISVFSLLAYHIYLVSRNCTTLESFRAPVFLATGQPDQNGFNLTYLENFRQVFGRNFFKAILPIDTSQFDGINFTNLTNLQMVNGDHGDISKITVIGNGWGRSSTVYNSFNQSNEKSNTSFEFPRNQQQYPQMLGFNLNNNQKNDSIVFDRTVGSLERGLSNLNRQKSVCLDSPNLKDGSSSLESSSHSENIPNLNINRVNTIILKKKQPHFTIITVVEDYDLQPNEEGNYNDGSSRNSPDNGINFIESDQQKIQREFNVRQSPNMNSSDALLSHNRFQSIDENSVGIMMDQ